MEIYVIRHTAVDVEPGICYGQTDLNLRNNFAEEVDLFKDRIPADLDAVISSPLKRCTYIADAFLPWYSTDDRLLEMDFGQWELRSWTAIPEEQLNQWMEDLANVAPPHGENLNTVQARINSFLDELRSKDHKKVLIVTHAGPIRCIWNYVLQTPLSNTLRIPVGYHEVLKLHLGKTPKEDFILEKQ